MFQIGISADVKSSTQKSFLPKFRKGFLKDVRIEEVEIKRGERKGTKQPSLCFEFRETEDKDRIYVHRFLPLDIKSPEDGQKQYDKFLKAYETFQGNLKHIIEVYVRFEDVADRLANLSSFEELFKEIVLIFNNQKLEKEIQGTGKDKQEVMVPKSLGKPIYLNEDNKYIIVWMKMVYQKGSSYISFPYLFDFIERYREGISHNLRWNPSYDFEEPQKATTTNSNIGSPASPGIEAEDIPEGWAM